MLLDHVFRLTSVWLSPPWKLLRINKVVFNCDEKHRGEAQVMAIWADPSYLRSSAPACEPRW